MRNCVAHFDCASKSYTIFCRWCSLSRLRLWQ
nr:MAG TPA: hypothetical protein [Caudoviricetes sp.]